MPRLAAIAVVALLVSSEGINAFGVAAAPGGGGAAKPQSHDRPSFPRRVLILPDSRAEVLERDLWHHHLKATLLAEKKDMKASIEGMPDPYSFNTKRYETLWLNFMVDELALCPGTLVVAHGTAADAVLRFAEKHEVWGAVLVCPGGEMYHAGDRHGRPYVWPRVKRGCQWMAMVHGLGDPVVGEAEARRVRDALGISSSLYREVPGGQQRLRDRTGCLIEVEELVTSALKVPAPAPKDSV